MNEFSEALKLYLRFPSEMEYWCAYYEDEEPSSYADNILKQIAGNDEKAQKEFLESSREVYQLALKDFNTKIIDPITKQVDALILKKSLPGGCKASSPRKINWIEYYTETRFTPSGQKSSKSSLGCAFLIEQGPGQGSDPQLVAYPRVWFSSRRPVSDFIYQIKKNKEIDFCNSNSFRGVWDANIAFACKGIPIQPNAQPDRIIEEITGVYKPMYEVLIALI